MISNDTYDQIHNLKLRILEIEKCMEEEAELYFEKPTHSTKYDTDHGNYLKLAQHHMRLKAKLRALEATFNASDL